MKFISHSPAETGDFAKKFIDSVISARLAENSGNKASGAFILGLYGNLGSGKTAFTQAVAEILGVQDKVTSPTFVIEKIYPLVHSLFTVDSQSSTQSFPPNRGTFTHLIHIDAYRLESSDEIRHLGWDEISADPHNLIIIEWPEKIAEVLPADHTRLKFTFIDETTREIETDYEMVQ